ncbi:hypothetical protein V9T40_011727 [Parthenolecanium corni]|uniref:Uncharacterized protein n=1 Tax=Parthenolecanium corni TaxID=536013 RepID=A0AAN9T7L7_9HEMI
MNAGGGGERYRFQTRESGRVGEEGANGCCDQPHLDRVQDERAANYGRTASLPAPPLATPHRRPIDLPPSSCRSPAVVPSGWSRVRIARRGASRFECRTHAQ